MTPIATTEARIAESLGLSEEDILTITDVEMVQEFLTDLSTRWNEILNQMRNNLLRVTLDRILIEKTDYHFNVRVIWRSGFEQEGSMSYRLFRDVGSSRGSSLRRYRTPGEDPGYGVQQTPYDVQRFAGSYKCIVASNG